MHQPSSFRVLIESAPPNLGDRTSKDVHKNWPQLRSLPRVSGINLTQKRKCKPNCICRMSAAEMICLGTTRAVSTDILHFRARVLGVYGQGLFHGQPLTPETVSAVPSSDRVVRFSRPSPPRHTGPRGLRRRGRSAVGGHATVSSDGHVSQAADLLASARARRAAAAPDVRSAGTVSPEPKYISSGVCPRNAECGSTRLCSST